jgi:hypothetical protein
MGMEEVKEALQNDNLNLAIEELKKLPEGTKILDLSYASLDLTANTLRAIFANMPITIDEVLLDNNDFVTPEDALALASIPANVKKLSLGACILRLLENIETILPILPNSIEELDANGNDINDEETIESFWANLKPTVKKIILSCNDINTTKTIKQLCMDMPITIESFDLYANDLGGHFEENDPQIWKWTSNHHFMIRITTV